MIVPNSIYSIEESNEWILKGQILPEDESLTASQIFDNNTYLEISIEDVSYADAESTLFLKKEINFDNGDRFPIEYEIAYPEVNLSSVNSINVRATIKNKKSKKLIFMSTSHYELPSKNDELSKPFDIKVTKIHKSKILKTLFE